MNPVQPHFLKAGIVCYDLAAGRAVRTLPMLVNPATLRRSFEIKESAVSSYSTGPLRLTAPAVESIDVEIKLDAADAILRSLDGASLSGAAGAAAAEGVRPWIAALQMLITPTADTLQSNDALRQSGALEIVPMEQPLTLFVWGAGNILPVKLASLSFNEDLFDPRLVPVTATATLGMRALSVADLGVTTRGGALFMAYLRGVERRAAMVPDGSAAELGIAGAL
ncbi:hypothetical protein OK349_04465 [Sphingomonas sp. BT-65]|uniref:hypothetical protein n=1 Tax=Sphingomonas sp. BT-65 TaxID=2989821 RepID=UPI00223644FF|nr:hypothetical protein [Sphingomonas sp. BT-65]MCW4460949.1 hypothetical protein [Sphingomonas sp. BT-65]